MKKIIVMPIKNEDWILELSLRCASLWADHIIVADQNSTDKTAEICQKFEKVIYIKNFREELDQSYARQLLLDKTRELFGNDNIILALDADEIISANVLHNVDFENIINNLTPGQSLVLQWIMLFGGLDYYIIDNQSVWGNNYKHFLFRDNGKYNFSDKKTSEPRMPEEYIKNSIQCEEIKILHFHFLDLERMLSKQRRYRISDYLENPGLFKAIKINRMYFITKQLKNLDMAQLPKSWLENYGKIDFDFKTERLYCYDIEVLKYFTKHNISKFKWLDIWDVDWEEKRKLTIKKGYKSEISDFEIKDPRKIFQKFYHNKLQNFLSDNSVLYKIYKLLKK
mgnify:CR=1 FL=1